MPNSVSAGVPAGTLSNKTPWGCEIEVHAVSRAPLSLDLRHGAECMCRGREKALVERYILDWISHRMARLREHPVRSCTRARVACELLGIDGLDAFLDGIDALYPLAR